MNPQNPQEQTTGQTQDMITRRVKINRNQTPQEVIDAISRKQFINPDVLATMSAGQEGQSEEVDVYFFKLNPYMSPKKLQRECEARGFKPDPYAVAQVNIDDPAFADTRPNFTQWDVSDGESSYVAFDCWNDERGVYVCRDGGAGSWTGGGDWWFGGVRQEAPGSDYIDEDQDWVP